MLVMAITLKSWLLMAILIIKQCRGYRKSTNIARSIHKALASSNLQNNTNESFQPDEARIFYLHYHYGINFCIEIRTETNPKTGQLV